MKNTKKTKRTFKMFAAWDYEFEEKEFNRMSEQGWQLINGGSFSQKYEYDDSVIYRYQIDYNKDIEDMARYEETFRDAGWERVNSTFNGWHVFRKAYDPSLPEEEYEIYTDEQSRNDMLARWRRISFIALGLNLINVGNAMRILSTSDAAYIGVAFLFVCALTIGFLIAGVVNINRMMNGQKNTHPFPATFFITLLFLMLVAIIAAAALVLIEEGSFMALGFMVGILLAGGAAGLGIVLARKPDRK